MRNKKKINLTRTAIFVLACIFMISLPVISSIKEKKLSEEVQILNDSINEAREPILLKDSIKNQLIEEVHEYIFKRFPKAHHTLPESIVENGLEHNIDILFMMAQTQIETQFGTAGAGRPTSRRSLFGVAVRRYQSYDKAVEDYVKILKKNYLTKGKTEHHLMKRYTTVGGARYASNPKYEIELKGAYQDIHRKTKIKELQQKYLEIVSES